LAQKVEEVRRCVDQSEQAGLVVLPAEQQFSVEGVLGRRYGVVAQHEPVRADLRVVVAATALGRDHDRG
jgi:hypothetical protein